MDADGKKDDTAVDSLPAGTIKRLFPFRAFFADAPPEKMFSSSSSSSSSSEGSGGSGEAFDLEIARGCFRHLGKLFDELRDFRAFELLRNHKMRSNCKFY